MSFVKSVRKCRKERQGCDMTEDMLVDLMTGLDVSLLENDFLERDLMIKKKPRRAFLHPLQAYRERRQRKPLSSEFGETIRTDLDQRVQHGVHSVKRRMNAILGIASGVATMIIVTLGFAALVKQRRA